MKVFLTESSNRPGRLFFTFIRYRDCFLFSSLQTQNPGEASVAMTLPVDTSNSSSVHGLICYATAFASGLLVYNSSSGRSTTLPKFEPETIVKRHFLGYDPIDGVYKVLCMTGPKPAFQVLTLGDGSSWKTIEVGHPHFPLLNHICINGVLYYEACSDMECKEAAFMSFHVRSESFGLIKRPGDALSMLKRSTVIRYEGKLAIISNEISANGGMALWVLEDAVKHEWLKNVFVLPNSWTSAYVSHRFVNVNDAGEVVLAPICLLARYYVIFYDPKRNSMRKVAVE